VSADDTVLLRYTHIVLSKVDYMYIHSEVSCNIVLPRLTRASSMQTFPQYYYSPIASSMSVCCSSSRCHTSISRCSSSLALRILSGSLLDSTLHQPVDSFTLSRLFGSHRSGEMNVQDAAEICSI